MTVASGEELIPVVVIAVGPGKGEGLPGLLEGLPQRSGAALLFHIADEAGAQNELERLARLLPPIPVAGVGDGVWLLRDHAYLLPPGVPVVVEGDTLRFRSGLDPGASDLDALLHSVAEDRGEDAAAVLLATPPDRIPKGLFKIRERGGLALVERPETGDPAVPHTPDNGSETGTDRLRVVPNLAVVGPLLAQHLPPPSTLVGVPDDDASLLRILRLLFDHGGYDFSRQDRAAVRNRIIRRRRLARAPNLRVYAKHLTEEEHERDALQQDLLETLVYPHPLPPPSPHRPPTPLPPATGLQRRFYEALAAEKTLLAEYAPPAVLVNAEGQVLYFMGETRRYLTPPLGAPDLDVVRMARSSALAGTLRRLLANARTNRKWAEGPVRARPLRFPEDAYGSELHVSIRRLTPADGVSGGTFLVTFEGETGEGTSPGSTSSPGPDEESSDPSHPLVSDPSTAGHLETPGVVDPAGRAHLAPPDLSSGDPVQRMTIATVLLDETLRIRHFTSTAHNVFEWSTLDVGAPFSAVDTRLSLSGEELAVRLRRTLEEGVELEEEAEGPDGSSWALRATRHLDPEDKVQGVILGVHDVTGLRELQAAASRMADSIQQFPDPFIVVDEDGAVTNWNLGAEIVYGRAADEMAGKSYLEVVPEELWEEQRTHFRARLRDPAPRRRKPVAITMDRVTADGRVFPVRHRVTAVHRPDHSLLAISDRDITEQVRTDRQRELLVRELDHRVKNSLAIVQGVLHQSLATAPDSAEAFAETFQERIQALSVAHEAMSSAGWQWAWLDDLVHLTLRPLESGEQIVVRGEGDVLLPEFVVSPLSMALHELATNAVRHGALSTGSGRILVEWGMIDGRRLHLRWTESGGPPVDAPARPGFGTRMIQEGIPYEIGGSAEIRFPPEGLVCEITIPLAREEEEDGDDGA